MLYRVVRKSLDTRGNVFNIECQGTCAPPCILYSILHKTLPCYCSSPHHTLQHATRQNISKTAKCPQMLAFLSEVPAIYLTIVTVTTAVQQSAGTVTQRGSSCNVHRHKSYGSTVQRKHVHVLYIITWL